MGWRRRKNTHDAKSGTKSATGAVRIPLHRSFHFVLELTQSQVGSAVGGVVGTAGNAVGAVGRGLGDTVNKTTNTHAGGNALKDIGNGVDRGTNKVGNGIERGSRGQNPRSPWSRFKSRTKV